MYYWVGNVEASMLTLAVSVVNNVEHRGMLHTNRAKIHVETLRTVQTINYVCLPSPFTHVA